MSLAAILSACPAAWHRSPGIPPLRTATRRAQLLAGLQSSVSLRENACPQHVVHTAGTVLPYSEALRITCSLLQAGRRVAQRWLSCLSVHN